MRRFLFAVVLAILMALIVLLAGGTVRGQSGVTAPSPEATPTPAPYTLTAYRQILQEIEHDLLRVPRPDALLPWMQGRLAVVRAITLPSGETIAPVNLLRNAATADEALARIDALQAQLDLATLDRLAERQTIVAAVVDQRVYKPSLSLWDMLAEWLGRLWNWLFPEGRDPFATNAAWAAADDAWTVITRLIALFGGLAIALLLGWWVARLWRNFVRNTDLQRRRAAQEDLPATAAEARVMAAELARTGSYRQAVRAMYLSALLALEEAELVVQDRTLTNRELLARAGGMAAGGAIRSAMQPVVQGFDDLWYGMREPDAATYAAFEADVATLNRRIQETSEMRKGLPEAQAAAVSQ